MIKGHLTINGREYNFQERKQIANEAIRCGDIGEVAQNHECSISLVQKALRENGLRLVTLTRLELLGVVNLLANTNLPYMTIGAKYGVGPMPIHRIAKQMKSVGFHVPTRPRGRPRKEPTWI